MTDNLIAWAYGYDLRVISHINDTFVLARPHKFKRLRPNCYLISNGMSGDNKAYMTIEFLSGYYEGCKIQGSIRKWYHGALSDKDLRWNEIEEAFRLLAQKLEMDFDDLCKFTLSKVEVGLCGKIGYDSTYVKSQIVGFRSSSYKALDGEGYRQFATKNKDVIAKIYDKKNEICSKIELIKSSDEKEFIEQAKALNIFRPEFTVQNGNAKVKARIGIKTIGDMIKHYPRLLAFFLKNIKLYQFNDKPNLEFHPIKGSGKEFTDYLLTYAINDLGTVGVRDVISQLAPNHRREARRKVKKLQVNTGVNNQLRKDVIGALQKQSLDLFRKQKL